MKPGNRGKQFAQEINDALRHLNKTTPVWQHGFDNTGHFLGPKRPADRVAFVEGMGWLLELKECRDTSIRFDRVETHQAKSLRRACQADCFGLVLIKWIRKNRSRAFLCTFDRWMFLGETLGRQSIPLADSARPSCLMEIERPNSIWLLGPAFRWARDDRRMRAAEIAQILRYEEVQ